MGFPAEKNYDIILFESLVKSGEIDDKDKYQQSIINYILSADEKSKGMDYSLKTIISPTEDRSKLKKFFGQVLKTSNAPIGKWPSKFMPVLMQQVAVNIAINEKDDNTPVFSVNGPPGTGKTTLLKEIVANNIVERAKLLAAVGDNPDDAFEKKTFLNGPSNSNSYFKFAPAYYSIKNDKINEYGMLVKNDDRVKKWLEENNIGTVHTFQGKGTDEVIFLLGCDKNSTSAANWVNKNIVNVAATRAKFRFYVIGDKEVWSCKPVKIAREVIGKTITEEELRKELDTVGSYTKADNTDYGVCPRCGRKLVKKDGRNGEFIGCTGYPNCKFSKNLNS